MDLLTSRDIHLENFHHLQLLINGTVLDVGQLCQEQPELETVESIQGPRQWKVHKVNMFQSHLITEQVHWTTPSLTSP